MNSNRRSARFIALALIMLLSAGFSSCSKEAGTGVVTIPEPTPGAPATRESDTINVVLPPDVNTTNPFFVTSRDLLSLYSLIFETLITTNETGEPVPNLAQTWTVDDTGTVWTFTLRSGVFWHHTGRELDAADVIFTLDLMDQIKEDSIHCQGMGYLKRWKEIDSKTVQITTYEPFYGALFAMDFFILPRDVGYTADPAIGPNIPVGTGPYMVSVFNQTENITLDANQQWWQEKPKINNIIALPYDDNSSAVAALSLSQLDVVQTDDLTVSQLREQGNVNTYEYTTRYYEFLAPNLNSVYFQDKKIRQAIAYALNRDEIVSNVYVNHAIVVDTLIPPTSILYEGKLLTYDYDIEEAKRLLMLAGWQDTDGDGWLDLSPDGVNIGFSIVLLTNNNSESPQRYEAALLIEDQLEKIGINVTVRAEEWETFNKMVDEKNFDILLAGWYMSDIPDLRFALRSDGKMNITGYISPDMDILLDNMMKQDTPEELKSASVSLQQLIIDDVPIISLYFRTHTLLTRSNITNVNFVKEESAYESIGDWNIN